MFRIEYSYLLYLLLLIPVFTFFFVIIRKQRVRLLKKYGELNIISRLFPDVSGYKPAIKFSILMVGLAILIFGVANPQIGSRLAEIKREGVDVVICLDVSNSMKAEDVKPNRLERAKQMVSRLVDKLMGDRVGIIVFAGEPYIQLPMTTDYSAAKLFLGFIDTDLIPVQGTAIGSAIELALEKFKVEDNKRKAMIIITDGENHEDDALKAATDAAANGYVVHTIGMGTLAGGPIPVYNNGMKAGLMKDQDGSVVTTKMDPQMLQQVASAGGGQFTLAGDSDPDLSKIVEKIAKMDKKEYESKLFSDYEDRFQFFIGAALLFLIAELFFSERKNKYIAGLKLFESKKAMKVSVIILAFLLPVFAFGQSPKTYIREGNKLYKQKKYNDAEVQYRKGLEKDANSNKANYNLGNSLYKQEKYDEAAEKYMDLGTKKTDKNVSAKSFHNLGNSLLKSKKYQESIAAYKNALKLNPADYETKYNLEYAKQMMVQQQQQQKQKQQNQNQDKNKDKDKDKKQQPQPQDNKKDDKNKDKQQQPLEKISKQDSERMLKALQDEEKKVQKDLKKKARSAGQRSSGRNW